MNNQRNFLPFFKISCLALIFVAYSFILFHNFQNHIFEQTIWQAEAILDGHLSIDPQKYYFLDIYHNSEGLSYSPLPLFPAILILPFVWIFNYLIFDFHLGYLIPFTTLLIFYLSFTLARKFSYKKFDSLLLSSVFCLGSGYILLATEPTGWFFNQVIGVAILLIALNEWYGKRRLWLIGLLMGFLLHTRYVSAVGTIFFCYEVLKDNHLIKTKLISVIKLLLPVFLGLALLLLMNQIKSGNLFQTGYADSYNGEKMEVAKEQYGYFSATNIPNNIYWYFLATPDPVVESETLDIITPYLKVSPFGYGFFFLSPFFISIFFYFTWNKMTKGLWFSSSIILVILLLHYTAGYTTFGPRYMMDLFPFWYAILLISLPKRDLSYFQVFLITSSIILNTWLILLNAPEIWPHP